MRLSSGFLRSLLLKSWKLECNEKSIKYRFSKSDWTNIDYEDLETVTTGSGTFSDKLRVKSNGKTTTFDGVSETDSKKFIQRTTQYATTFVSSLIDTEKSSLEQVIPAFNKVKDGDFYLNHSKVVELRESLPGPVKLFESPYLDTSLLPSILKQFAQDYRAFIDPKNKSTIQRNKRYVERKKQQYKFTFDNSIEKYPLTEEQRDAVVTEEDNTLLIAAAGSGKSSTVVAKIFYLLKEKQHKANQVIAFAYNKQAQLELTSRIDALFEKFNWQDERVPARTFHGFCMEVLAKTNQAKPSIAEIATSSKKQQVRFFTDLVNELIETQPGFKSDLLNYYSVFKLPQPREGTINSSSEYNNYLSSLDAKSSRDPETGEWNITLTSMDGVNVRSLEELRIANWLFLQGIRFEYEKPYEHNTATETHRQYYPDFYYPDIGVWHEHFALNNSGQAPSFMRDYESGVVWKRQLHHEHQTKLIETHSAHYEDGTVFQRLDQALTDAGIVRNPPSEAKLNQLIAANFSPEHDLELVITFLKHFKTNNMSIDVLRQRAKLFPDVLRAKAFLPVFNAIFTVYDKKLKARGEIDFEDLIHQASEKIEQGSFKSPFEYIMVDEFQDASQDRLRLIQALANQRTQIKLFAVGDDWQSIYRFSGADLEVMKQFPNMFGYTKDLRLTHTFRSAQEIIDVASEFIQRNPNQFKKDVNTIFSNGGDSVILRPYAPNNPDNILEPLFNTLQRRAERSNETLSVFILTRYTAQKPSNLVQFQRSYPNLDIEWKTIHASKGLEADCVVLHHMNCGRHGFPCEINDDPLLDLVIPENETFPHAEERRLLYVALTRARKAVYGFYHPSYPSAFIKELSDITGVKVHDPRFEPVLNSGDACPQCRKGVLYPREANNQVALFCSDTHQCGFSTEIRCPECKVGEIVVRKAKQTGRTFYACNQFPRCKHIYRDFKSGSDTPYRINQPIRRFR